MEEAVQLGFESSPSQIPVLIDRFLIQLKKHYFLPSSNARQRYMHIYYYGNTTFEEAVATVQPPQVQLSILFCSEGNTFHTYFTEFWIFLQWSLSIQGEILLPFPAWSAGSALWFPCAPAVSTLQHPPCTNVQNFWGAQIHLLPGAQPMKSQSHSGQYLWTLQEHHWKTNCHSG